MISARTEVGNTSAGMVAPENNNIGKYSRLVTIFMDFVVLQTAATSSPIENMETIASSHNRIKIRIFPRIRYPQITAAIVNKIVDTTATTLLERILQASSLAGEHGLQYILLNIP